MNFILLLSFLLCGIDYVQSQTLNNEIAMLDCNGNINLLPNNPFLSTKFYVGEMINLINFGHDTLYNRLKCKCPSITPEEFNRRFAIHTWDFWLHLLTGNDEASSCAASAPAWDENYNVTKDFKLKMDLKSCTYDYWSAGNNCYLKMSFPVLGMEFQVAIGHCPTGHLPFVSVTCKGAACDTIGMPCNDNTECASPQTCYNIGSSNNTEIFNAFVQGYLYDKLDTAPGCYAPSQLLSNVFDDIRKLVYGKSAGYTFSRIPVLDFKLCSYEFSSDAVTSFGCTGNTTDAKNNTVLKCTTLQDWDGKLADGTSATSDSRLQGKIGLTFDTIPSTLTSNNAVPLFYHSCDNDLIVFPQKTYGLLSHLWTSYSTFFADIDADQTGSSFMIASYALDATAGVSNIMAKFPWINKVTDIWYPYNFAWQKCRASGRSQTLSESEYMMRYGWMFPYGINLLTNPQQNFPNTMSDWYASIMKDSSFKKFIAPSTCTYDHYLQTTECSLSFTGFQSLINSDITLNILIKDCPKWHVPAVYVECQGNDCGLITKPQACTTDNDCTKYPGTKCLTMANTQSIDFIQAYFTHKYYPVDSCGSPSLLLKDLNTWFSQYSTGATGSVCFWDVNYLVQTVNITKWAENEYLVSGDSFSIKDLKEWSPSKTQTQIPGSAEQINSDNNGNNSSGSIISFSWVLLFVLVIMIWTSDSLSTK